MGLLLNLSVFISDIAVLFCTVILIPDYEYLQLRTSPSLGTVATHYPIREHQNSQSQRRGELKYCNV
jgi:hypothetical protein